jgi:UDP-N-acetylglucosamine--N-acetylmuramyl-(pentapeptide) pyrophosphoryl-undecaprenol N-acetylglucosamine transferase
VTTLTVVSYAINGRGMGHLTRQLAILRWIRRIAAVLDVGVEPWVITSSEADTLARREGVPSLKMPSKAMFRDADMDPARYLAVARSWVLNAIAGLRPDLLLVDTFAGGSFGELVASLELAKTRVLVRRRVRPERLTPTPA